MRSIFVMIFVGLLAAVVMFYGCDKDTRTVTVTITHFYNNVDLDNAAEGILGYSCYNLDNADMGPHYGTVSVGGIDTYGGAGGNEMDFGFICFDFGTLDLPNGADLTELTVYLNNLMLMDCSISIFVTLQDTPIDNNILMIENICSGTLLCQVDVDSDGLFAMQIDPSAVTLHDGKLYIGLYSNVSYNDNRFILCDNLTSYVRARFTTEK